MAFLDHIDPGNSGGSVIIPETHVQRSFKPIIYPCSLCDRIFKDQESLSEHRISEHPVKRPMLLINGEPLRKDEITVRSTMTVADIEFTDVDEIYLNGNKVNSQTQLKECLCRTDPMSFQLRLVNRNFPVEYRWNVDIAEEEELSKIDEQFYSAFGSGLTLDHSFSLFNERTARLSSAAKSYAAGLSCYVTAVITKDQLPGAALEYHKYGHKLGEAMDILSDYRSRPLASAIFLIAEFMQNDFSLQAVDASLPKLQAAKLFFNSGAFVTVDALLPQIKAIPIDSATESIVDFCASSYEEKSCNISRILVLQKASNTDERDKIKSIFILWCFFKDTGEEKQVKGYRGTLIHRPYFGDLVKVIEEC